MGNAMNLVDEYLRAVAHLLPKDQRDDIIAELKDMILTRIEGREAELGRPLTDDEVETLLRETGHPLVVAGRYRPGPQYVVGPALYPYWMFGVKVAISMGLAISALVFVAKFLGGGNVAAAFGQATASGFSTIITVIGWATIAAWLTDYFGVSLRPDQWRVKDLRFLNLAFFDFEALSDRAKRAADTPRRVRATAGRGIGMIAYGGIFVLWWVGVLNFGIAHNAAELRGAGLDPGPLAAVDWAGFKTLLFWPVLAYGAAVIASGALFLARPRAVRLLGVYEVVSGAATVAIMAWIWTASPLSAAIRVDTLAEFIVRMKSFAVEPPFPLTPMMTLAVAGTALGGLINVVQGLARMAFPGVWR
jgi:hypothetical protein